MPSPYVRGLGTEEDKHIPRVMSGPMRLLGASTIRQRDR